MTKKTDRISRSSVVGSGHIQRNPKISISGGTYDENIEGDYVQGNKTDQSRNIKITGGTINTGAFNLGDISGTVANTINQLPASSDPDKPGIKELLTQLAKAIIVSEYLDVKHKTKALKQVQVLAKAAFKLDSEEIIDLAEDATTMLVGTMYKLPASAALVTTSKELLPAIAKFFE